LLHETCARTRLFEPLTGKAVSLFWSSSIGKGIKMKVELVKKSDNPLFKRTEVEFNIDHSGAPTPKRIEVIAQLSSLLGSPAELLVIDKFASTHGHQLASGIARVYGTREQLEALEPEHLRKRGLPKEQNQEKPAEAKPEKKPAEAKPEKKPAEAKPAEEKPKEVKKEKAGDGKSGKEG
jgi:ribosomal protein S24E